MFLLIFLSVTIPNEERKILPSSAVRTVQEDLRIASRGPNEINRSSSGPATHWLFGEVSTVPVSTKILTTQPTTLTKTTTAVTATTPQTTTTATTATTTATRATTTTATTTATTTTATTRATTTTS